MAAILGVSGMFIVIMLRRAQPAEGLDRPGERCQRLCHDQDLALLCGHSRPEPVLLLRLAVGATLRLREQHHRGQQDRQALLARDDLRRVGVRRQLPRVSTPSEPHGRPAVQLPRLAVRRELQRGEDQGRVRHRDRVVPAQGGVQVNPWNNALDRA
ncbi:hypothetical protein DFH06DRAFT_1260660 [Mycena polygramma]|nr:hypothetical protein DFH06DRAFT_1260660 [Mycena polygramma]